MRRFSTYDELTEARLNKHKKAMLWYLVIVVAGFTLFMILNHPEPLKILTAMGGR